MDKFKGVRWELRSEADNALVGGIEVRKPPRKRLPSLCILRGDSVVPVATFYNDSAAEFFITHMNNLSIVLPK